MLNGCNPLYAHLPFSLFRNNFFYVLRARSSSQPCRVPFPTVPTLSAPPPSLSLSFILSYSHLLPASMTMPIPSLSSGFVFRFGFSPSECVFRFFTHNRPSCRRERSSKKKTTRSSQRTDIHDLEGGELSRTISPLRWRKLPKSWKL